MHHFPSTAANLHFLNADLSRCCSAAVRRKTKLYHKASQSHIFPSPSTKTNKKTSLIHKPVRVTTKTVKCLHVAMS